MEESTFEMPKRIPKQAPPVNKFRFCQLSAKQHFIQFGWQQADEIDWRIFGQRTRDQLTELHNRLATQSTPVPLVLDDLSTPIPGSIMFVGVQMMIGDTAFPDFSEKLGNYLRLLDEGGAPACERDPFDLGV